ncbi:MAG: hypothetical protein AVDCRST_MAG10-1317, partial [uncultured Acidimicrobiales bacterium]
EAAGNRLGLGHRRGAGRLRRGHPHRVRDRRGPGRAGGTGPCRPRAAAHALRPAPDIRGHLRAAGCRGRRRDPGGDAQRQRRVGRRRLAPSRAVDARARRPGLARGRHPAGGHVGAGQHLLAHARPRPQPRSRRRPPAGLRAEQRRGLGERHRSGHHEGDRPVQRRHPPAPRDAVLGPDQAVRQQHRGEHPHRDRPAHGAAHQGHPDHGPLQPLLHPRRRQGHRGRRALHAPRLLQHRRLDIPKERGRALGRRRPRRLLPRRPLLHGQLRVQRPGGQGRHRDDDARGSGRGGLAADRREDEPGRQGALRGQPGSSWSLAGRPGDDDRDRLHPDGHRRPRTERQPGRRHPLREQPHGGHHLGDRLRHPDRPPQVAGRRQPGHDPGERRRQPAVDFEPVPRLGFGDRHHQRPGHRHDPDRSRCPRSQSVPAAGAVQRGPQRGLPL